MHLHRILTKEFLTDQLIGKRKKLSVLAEEIPCSKVMIIRYAKKHDLYDEVRKLRSVVHGITQDLNGQLFGDLMVENRAENDKFGKARWNCKCKCGNTKLINAASLIRGLSKTCGKCERVNFTGYKDISGAYFKHMQRGAKARNLSFDIEIEDIYDLWLKQDEKCALSGVDIFFVKNQDTTLQTASVDRMDSKKGYTLDNIQIIHKRLNRVKSILGNEELVFWAHSIAKTHKNVIVIDTANLKWNYRS